MSERDFSEFGNVFKTEKPGKSGNVVVTSEVDGDLPLRERLKKGIAKPYNTKFRGYNIDEEVLAAIDIMAEGREKGYKSFIVNEILKEYFTKEKLL